MGKGDGQRKEREGSGREGEQGKRGKVEWRSGKGREGGG